MSRIDELIAKHCPGGVQRVPLSEVGELIRGRRFTKADYVEEGLRCDPLRRDLHRLRHVD